VQAPAASGCDPTVQGKVPQAAIDDLRRASRATAARKGNRRRQTQAPSLASCKSWWSVLGTGYDWRSWTQRLNALTASSDDTTPARREYDACCERERRHRLLYSNACRQSTGRNHSYTSIARRAKRTTNPLTWIEVRAQTAHAAAPRCRFEIPSSRRVQMGYGFSATDGHGMTRPHKGPSGYRPPSASRC